ncbi:MAG: choice-of-anchor J domain-containing protein [Bacteroidales bacterium]|nr:choice-of-anchor J domain-containing protein [Bacteroidales bacterium]
MNTFTKKMMPLLMAIIATFCFNFASVAQNMVTNPGFENWTDGKPDGWFGERTNLPAANVVQYTADVHGGSSACQLIRNASDGNGRLTSKAVSVVNGQEYTIKFWVRGHGDCRAGLWDGQGTNGDNYIYDPQVINVNSDTWAQQTFSVTAPVTAGNAEFIILVRNTEADKDHLQIDDVEVTGGGDITLKANFKADKTTAETGATIYFTDLSTGNPLAWDWTVEGPETFTSDKQNPSFTFTKAGSYDVKLVVSDESTSDEEIKADYIVIEAPGDYIFFQNWNDMNRKGWSEVSKKGDGQKWTILDKYGIGDSPCIRMSGHDGSNSIENEDWLLSPEFALESDNNAILTFYSARSWHAGPALEVYFSGNYTGDVATTDWTKLNCTLSPGNNNYEWISSGNISLSAYSGLKCCVAFKYTSTNNESCIWELDDIGLKSQNVSISNVDQQTTKIYPNPSSTGIFTITTDGNATIKALTMDGRLIKEQPMNKETTLDLSDCPKGTYLLQITHKNGTVTTRKVVKQ